MLPGEIAEGLRHLLRDPHLRVITAFSATTNLAGGMLQAVLVDYLVRDLGVGEWTAGTLLPLVGLGGVAGAVVAAPMARWFGSARGLVLSQLCSAPLALLAPLTTLGADGIRPRAENRLLVRVFMYFSHK